MAYIVIERFFNLEDSCIVTDEDGLVKVFDSYEEAKKESGDCQNGIVVEV